MLVDGALWIPRPATARGPPKDVSSASSCSRSSDRTVGGRTSRGTVSVSAAIAVGRTLTARTISSVTLTLCEFTLILVPLQLGSQPTLLRPCSGAANDLAGLPRVHRLRLCSGRVAEHVARRGVQERRALVSDSCSGLHALGLR
jgi:hypothetical protein